MWYKFNYFVIRKINTYVTNNALDYCKKCKVFFIELDPDSNWRHKKTVIISHGKQNFAASHGKTGNMKWEKCWHSFNFSLLFIYRQSSYLAKFLAANAPISIKKLVRNDYFLVKKVLYKPLFKMTKHYSSEWQGKPVILNSFDLNVIKKTSVWFVQFITSSKTVVL